MKFNKHFKRTKAYKEGVTNGKSGGKWVDNPYKEGSLNWQYWNEGRSIRFDKITSKLLSKNPELLKGP